jgi:hypothetical protein
MEVLAVFFRQQQKSCAPCPEKLTATPDRKPWRQDTDLQYRLTISTALSPLVINFQAILSSARAGRDAEGAL